MKRLAVIIGEEVRQTQYTIKNLECFLELLPIPYDIYACVDNPSIFNNIKNVKSATSFKEDCLSSQKWAEIKETSISYMHGAAWQWIKCNYALSQIRHPKEYSHIMKLRTDGVFDFRHVISRKFGHPIKDPVNTPNKQHVQFLRDMFHEYIRVLEDEPCIDIHGDKLAVGDYDVTNEWLHHFINKNSLEKLYTIRDGPDWSAVKAHKLNTKAIPTTYCPMIIAGDMSWKCMSSFNLTTFYDSSCNRQKTKDNSSQQIYVGMRHGGGIKKTAIELNAIFNNIINYSEKIKELI